MTQQAREKEKKRLVELLKTVPTTMGGLIDMETVAQYADEIIDIEQIADHLLSNGVIVPPCKVGDTVFAIWCRPSSKKWFVQSSIVIGITFMKCDWFVETDDNNLHLFGSLLNKDWFTDHEAAERALKERETNELD